MKYAMKDFHDAIEALLRGSAADKTLKSVTVFCSPLSNCTRRVTAARRHRTYNTYLSKQILITFGGLNFPQREFVKLCKKAKTRPRRLWFKFYPKVKK